MIRRFIGEVIEIVESGTLDKSSSRYARSARLCVGLRPVWSCVAVLDAKVRAAWLEGMLFAVVAGCELGAVVGHDLGKDEPVGTLRV